ncbi:hypothetical protein N0V88_004109 [Collariella sp. IMI 366227]|nr:hypothetical protein N0V88_004109 [Collariella sp. IMI 366227]
MGYNARVEGFRDDEFPMLKDSVYLDHAGTTPYSKSLMDQFVNDMTSNLFGNPHSASPSSQLSTTRIEDIRLRVLRFFNADPAEFDLVFVANATAGIKLVADAFRAAPGGFDYAYHQASHTSLVGVREEARNSLCLDDQQVEGWLEGSCPFEVDDGERPVLFAYPGQSNMDGRRYPLSWAEKARARGQSRTYTLLDAAALVCSSPLDLSLADAAPDFTVLSFYKVFGFPDLGALIVRRGAEEVFNSRRYFGGGTVDMVVCLKEQWHATKSQFLHERLEDGTLPIHSIIALDAAFDVHKQLFGSMRDVAAHTSFLSRRLYHGLKSLRHGNREPVFVLYSPDPEVNNSDIGSGPVIAFNIRNSLGAWVSLTEIEKLATLKGFHIRTGGVCNPGGIASALGLQPWEMMQNFSSGFRCGSENDILAGKPTGVIRASLGAMSTISDVDRFVDFLNEFYRDVSPPARVVKPPPFSRNISRLHIHSISIYPIKSCGRFEVPPGADWEVRPEGLAWDREWCLVHQGTGQALNQKRYPKMALLQPSLDFQKDIIGVPCMLARFPPGGQGKSMRHAKAHLQKHQLPTPPTRPVLPGSFPPSPPDSDTEKSAISRRILLSNESPILTITLPSVSALNEQIQLVKPGSPEILPAVFRANIVLAPAHDTPLSSPSPYAEDAWSSLMIGPHEFEMLGACRRCHMVCINQETAEKSEEPFVTLSKTRRFEGKVFFGVHMGLKECNVAGQFPTVRLTLITLIEHKEHLDTMPPPDESVSPKNEYFWQPYPSQAPFLTRLAWSVDLLTSLRGAGWNFAIPTLPHPPLPTPNNLHPRPLQHPSRPPRPHPLVSRTDTSRSPTYRHFLLTRLRALALSWFIIDFLTIFIRLDPYFVLGPDYYNQHHPILFHLQQQYPSMPSPTPRPHHPHDQKYMCLVAVIAGLHLYASFAQLVLVFLLRDLDPNGVKTELWANPTLFGGFTGCVLDRGLAGFWGGSGRRRG